VGLDKLEPLTQEEERILEEGVRKMQEVSYVFIVEENHLSHFSKLSNVR